MASDVNEHCQNCTLYQQAKLNSPPKALLVSLPIGRPWEMFEVVHINRIQHRIQPPDISSIVNRPTTNVMETWSPPQTEHIVVTCDVDPPSSSPANCNTSQRRYPLHNRRPPGHLQL